MLKYDAVIISDLHLGARNAQPQQIVAFLGALQASRLIVAGDVFDSPNLRGMTAEHYEALEALRNYSRRSEVIWIAGNHDPAPAWFRDVLQAEALDEYVLEVGSARFLVAHGHRYDASIHWPKWIVRGAEAIYHLSQRVDQSDQLARRLKRGSKRFCRVIDNVRELAMADASRRGFDGVILGHTHVAEHRRDGAVDYLNTGCWTERPAGFIGLQNGRLRRGYWFTARDRWAEESLDHVEARPKARAGRRAPALVGAR